MNTELVNSIDLIYFTLGLIAIMLFIVLIIHLLNILYKYLKNKLSKKLCKNGYHKWVPVYIKGEYNGEKVKFISCFCDKCYKGYTETLHINGAAKNREYGTYNEKYFNK